MRPLCAHPAPSGQDRRVSSQECGPTGFLRGIVAMGIREGIYSVGAYTLTPLISRALMASAPPLKGRPVLANVLGALGSGMVAAVLTNPADTVKTCQQTDLLGETYGGVLGSLALLWADRGLAGLFPGLGARIIEAPILFFITIALRGAYIRSKAQSQRSE